MHPHEIERRRFAPPELAFEPRQPVAMPGDRLGVREPAPDFDNVTDGALAERANDLSVLGKPARLSTALT
jgi:hypothetical protein